MMKVGLRTTTFVLSLLFVQAAFADETAWGPRVGAQVSVSASDQAGQPRDISNLAGEHGLLLFFSRSADW